MLKPNTLLGFWDGDGENDEEEKVYEENGEWRFKDDGRILWGTRVEKFWSLSWKTCKITWSVDSKGILIFIESSNCVAMIWPTRIDRVDIF